MPSTPTHAPDQVLGRLSTHVTPACFRSLPTLAFTTLASSLYRRGRPWPSAPLQTHLLSRYCHSCPLYAIPLLARRQHGRGGAQEMYVKEYKHGPTARARRTLAGEERTCSLYITRRACIGQQIVRMRTAGEVGGHRWDKRRTRDLMLRRERKAARSTGRRPLIEKAQAMHRGLLPAGAHSIHCLGRGWPR
jgi:hypothetical protein